MLQSVQGLRALAAYLVVFFHIRALETLSLEEAGATEIALTGGLFRDGYLGVDLFFAISGFVMVYVTANISHGTKAVGPFLFARFTRIYPVWWLFAGIMLAYILVTYGNTWPAEMKLKEGVTPDGYLLRSFLLLPQPNHPVLGVGWTLIHEMYFYIIFAFFLLLPRTFLPFLLGIWGGVVVIDALAGLSGPVAEDFVSLLTYPMTLEFIAGAFVGLLIVSNRVVSPIALSVAGALWLLLAMAMYPDPAISSEFTRFNLEWGRVLVFGPPCVLLLYGLVGCERTYKFKLPSFVVDLGNWSYSLYLSHMLTLSALRRIYPMMADIAETQLGIPAAALGFLRLGTPGIWDNLFFIVTGVIASTVIAGLTFVFLETPLMRAFRAARAAFFERKPSHKGLPAAQAAE